MTTNITELTKVYLEKPYLCLYCGQDAIDSEPVRYDEETGELSAVQRCLRCGKTWGEIYKIVRLDIPEEDNK